MSPAHQSAEVLASSRVGAYQHLVLSAPGVAESWRPGTFVALSVGDGAWLARRAYWILRVFTVGARAGGIEIVVEPVGRGGRWLAERPVGSRVELTGALGRPFALPQEPVETLLVAEERGAAAVFGLAERLRDRGCGVHLLIGAADAGRLISADDLRRHLRAVSVVTADGSVGRPGSLAEAVPELLERTGADVVYAAGRTDLLHAVAAAAEQQGAWSQTAVEHPLACGTGLCHGCLFPVVGADGVSRQVRACTEGPVFRGDRVRWADLVEER